MRPMGPNQGMPPRFPNQNQWNGPPRQNGPRGMLPNCPPGPPQHQHRPMVSTFNRSRMIIKLNVY